MTTQTSQGVASRLGYGLGQAARLVWCSQSRTLRWVKRLAVALVLLYFSAGMFHWIASVFMGVLATVLILLAIVKGDFSILEGQRGAVESEDGFRYGLSGYGQYSNGARIDSDDE